MGGGLIQLAAVGIPDLYLTGDPQITWFKILYRRYTEFSMVDYPIKINGDPQPGSTHMINIGPIADKLNRVCLVIDVPSPEVVMSPPTVATIQQIIDNQDIGLKFTSTKKSTDIVTYADIFSDNPLSIGSQMTILTNKLNTKYDSRLNILNYIQSTYSVSKDRYLGRHIALDATRINIQALSDGTGDINVDIQGYVLLTREKTRELYNSTEQIINLNEKSFMYYPSLDLSSPVLNNDNLPIPARLSTINNIMKVYPRFVSGYTRIESIEDFKDIANIDTENYHVMISIDYLRRLQKKYIYDKRLYLNSLDGNDGELSEPSPQTKDTNMSNMSQLSIIFDNFNYNGVLSNKFINYNGVSSDMYETGIYLFDVDPLVTDYPTAVTTILDTGRLEIPVKFIVKSSQINSLTNTQTTESSGVFNRYNINENAIYDPSWEITDNLSQVINLDEQSNKGFFMLNVDELDTNLETQQVIDLITSGNPTSQITEHAYGQTYISGISPNTMVRFNPRFIHCNADRLGFTPHTINHVWVNSIVKNIQISDPLDPDIIVTKQIKVENLIDGVTTIIKLFKDLYTIPNIKDTIDLTDKQIAPMQSLYNLLVALYEDILNNQTQARNYKIQNVKLYNAIDIKKEILDKLINDIIYVDYYKLGYGIDQDLTPFYRQNNFTIDSLTGIKTKTSDTYMYNNSSQYIYETDPLQETPADPSQETMVSNRNNVYELSKYILWTYYLENIYLVYDPILDNRLDVATFISTLSYMLIQIPIIPVGIIDPDSESESGYVDPTTENIRFASNDIDDITKCIIYDDQNIIETYDVSVKASIPDSGIGVTNIYDCVTNLYDYKYIYTSKRYCNLQPDSQSYPLTNGNVTCINREIEFYHMINSFTHDDISTNDTVYDYFMKLIDASDTDNKNYLHTVSFNTTKKYLSVQFSDIFINDESIVITDINADILTLIVKNFNYTLLNYIKIVFGAWKNSTYSDTDTEPQYSYNLQHDNELTTHNIDYGANYVSNYLKSLADKKVITQQQITQYGDPLLLRTRHYAGINSNFRPFMGFSYKYQIDYTDPSTYATETQFIINNTNFINDPIRQESVYVDVFEQHIDAQIGKAKKDMELIARYNLTVRDSMRYIYWRDFYKYMLKIIENLNTDLQIPVDKSLVYYNNTMILNHLPVAITYYYGQYLQYIIITQFNANRLETNNVNINNVTYSINDEDIWNNKIFDVEPENIQSLECMFLGTDVRLNPKCSLHGHINAYPNIHSLDVKCFKYLISNDVSYVQDICPLCFKTFEFKRLFNIILYKSLLSPITNTPIIVDNANIGLLRSSDLTIGSNNVYSDYTAFLYRPEDVIYDDVSKSYFYSITEFAIYRIATILFRYKHMIENICNMDDLTYQSFIDAQLPSDAQIGAENPVDLTTETTRFYRFKASLDRLHQSSSNLLVFSSQMTNMIRILTHTGTDENLFKELDLDLTNGEIKTYGITKSFIGNNINLNSDIKIFDMIPNIIYNNGAKIVRHQIYRGNVILWILLQRAIIANYNGFFNNVLDPKKIKFNNTKDNVSPDLYTEIYTILTKSIALQYVKDVIINEDGSIDCEKINYGTMDFYRNKQTREYQPTNINASGEIIANDLISSVCTKAINYCRQLMLFYNMLLARYKKMSFLLTTVQNTTLNYDAYYFNFSQDIAKEYLAKAITTIKQMKVVSVNPTLDKEINNKFYYLDTSEYFFIDSTTFRNSQVNKKDFVSNDDSDYFDMNNNYHISEGFSINMMTNMMRILGIHDTKLTRYRTTYPYTNIIVNTEYYDILNQGLDIAVNENFKDYFTFDIATHLLKNFEIYVYANNIIYNLETNCFEYNFKNYRIINSGVINKIWYYYPTISNIMYDQNYTQVVWHTYPGDDTDVTVRTYTNCVVTSPLIYLRDKIRYSATNKHNHTTSMIEWEDTFYSSDSDESVAVALTEIFNSYQYFAGSYNFLDIGAYFDIFRSSLQKPGSIASFIIQYEQLLNTIINITSIVFTQNIPSPEEERSRITLILQTEGVKAVIQHDNLKILTVETINLMIESLSDIEIKIMQNLDGSELVDVPAYFTAIKTALLALMSKINGLNMKTTIGNTLKYIYNISNKSELDTFLKLELVDIRTLEETFTTAFDQGVSAILSALKIMLLETSVDNRIYTPSVLYNLKNLEVLHSFKNYSDVILLLSSRIMAKTMTIITPDTPIDMYLALTSGKNNFYNLTGVAVDYAIVNDVFVAWIILDSRIESFDLMIQNIKVSIDIILNQMSQITVLSRYIDQQKDNVDIYDRYDFNSTIVSTDNKIKYTYEGSELYIKLIKILTTTVPHHAWARYLGYRMIEEVGLIIDGEQIDIQDGELMLLLHKMHSTIEHERGDNIMLGHIPEMYTISSTRKPAMRLYVQLFLFFGRHYGNSLPLINMLYSDIKIKLKLRNFEELFYMEQGALLKKPINMKIQMLGNYIYLGAEERKTCAITKSETIMERFITSGTLVRNARDLTSSMLTNFGTVYNVLKIRYQFSDPCKYLLWKIQIEYPDTHPADIISWDLANYRIRHKSNTNTTGSENQLEVIDVKSQIIHIVNRTLIEFNGKTREQWKDNTYFQILQPYNKHVNALDSGEALYAMCLFPSLLQPSGATNLSQIEDLSFHFEINKQIVNLMKTTGVKIKIIMWECSYNIFVAISGFGALRFYA